VNPHVRFEEEADAEYRAAGRWYEDHRQHLAVEFFDAVDATIDQIVMLPDAGSPMPQMPADLPVRRRAVPRFPYHRVPSHAWPDSNSRSLTTGGSRGTGESA
jgi:plasmid stabilization system protein ParE